MDKKKFNDVRKLSKPLFIVKGQPGNLKNVENAMADLEMARNLGNNEACQRFKSMTK